MSTIVITGAGRGIGLELTSQYLKRGDTVIATYRNQEGKKRLESLGFETTLVLYQLDVRNDQEVKEFADQLKNTPVDILINNAGIMGDEKQTLEEMNYEQWMQVLAVNSIAPFRMATALLPHLKRSSHPKIITLSSIMGRLSRKNVGFYAYRSSKAALNKVMQVMAADLEEENIIVCPIHPGWVQTDMGGVGAELPVEESAKGFIEVIDSLTMEHSGRFWQWNGEELPW